MTIEKIKKTASAVGDEGALERISCTFDWELSWNRVISLIWGIMDSPEDNQHPSKLTGIVRGELLKVMLNSPSNRKLHDVVDEVFSENDREDFKAQLENDYSVDGASSVVDFFQQYWSDDLAAVDGYSSAKEKSIFIQALNHRHKDGIDTRVIVGLLHYYGYENIGENNVLKVEWAVNEDQSLTEYNLHLDSGGYVNGWIDEATAQGESPKIQDGLSFELILKLPSPPSRRLQPQALMDYSATGISIPFTS